MPELLRAILIIGLVALAIRWVIGRINAWIDAKRAENKIRKMVAEESVKDMQRAYRIQELGAQVQVMTSGVGDFVRCACNAMAGASISAQMGEQMVWVRLRCVRCGFAVSELSDYDDEGLDSEAIARGKAVLAGVAKWNRVQAGRVRA